MPRSEARLKVSIWANPDWRDLSLDAQWTFMMLLTQPDLSVCGTLPYLPGRWRQLAADLSDVDEALDELEHGGFVLVDRDTSEVAVRSFPKHDGIMRSPKGRAGFWSALAGVFSTPIQVELVAQVLLMETGPTWVSKAVETHVLTPDLAVAGRAFLDSLQAPLQGASQGASTDSGKGLPGVGVATPTPTPTPTRPLRPVDNTTAEQMDRAYQRATP